MKKIKTVLIISIILLFISSCKKDDCDNIENNNGKSNRYKSSIINPFDIIGQQHNEVINAIGLMQDFPFISEEDMGNYMLSYLDEMGLYDSIHNLDFYNNQYDNMDAEQSLSDLSIMLYNESKINSLQLFYLAKIDTIIVNGADDNENLNLNIDELEENLLENTELNNDEKVILWGALSITRYSANYWYDASINNENPWHITYPNLNKSHILIINYTGTSFGRTMADVKGWVNGLCGMCEGNQFHCAKRGSINASRRYVVDHLVFLIIDK